MSCDLPSKPNRLRYAGAAIVVLGVGLAAVSTAIVDSWTALLPYIGSTLIVIGGSRIALADSGIESVARLLTGAPDRRAQLTNECHAMAHRMERVVEPICPKEHVRFAVREATYRAAKKWPERVNDAFRWYLLCETIRVGRDEALKADPSSTRLTEHQLAVVVRSLHDTSQVPAAVIARILDVDLAVVLRSLRTAPGPQ